MSKGLIHFDAVRKVLERNKFFGFTAKRENGRIEYTYISVPYHHVTFNVLTTRLNSKDIVSKKIVLGIKINDQELQGWNDFMEAVNNVYKLHNKLNKEKYGITKKS